MRTFWTSLAAGLVLGLPWQLTAQAQTPEEVVSVINDRAAAYGVSAATLTRIIACESSLGQHVLGDHGHSHGPVQLSDLPTGLLRHFVSVGYDDAYSPWQSIDYLARVAAGTWRGDGVSLARWSCY